MSLLRTQRRPGPAAFSLIEMLVVMVIMGILLFLTVPASISLQQSSNLSLAGQAVTDEIAVAREIAAATNRVVEVRFLSPSKWAALASPNYTGFHAIQLWSTNEVAVPVPVDRLLTLPDSVEISSNSTLSPLLSTPVAAAKVTTSTGTYVSFYIRPAGNVVVGGTAPGTTDNTEDNAGTRAPSYYFTILPVRYDTSGNPPGNYITIQLNPDTGRTQGYRP
jgi:uncharacterized protein (TIGR02596 family)